VPFTYPFPRPSVTVDVVLFAMRAGDLAVLLIRRAHEPFQGAWALPGGFVDEHEPLEKAALRELAEETGVTGIAVEQLGAFGDPGRDPRGHTVSVAYYGFAGAAPAAKAGDDAAEAEWHPMKALMTRRRGAVELAFDHRAVLALAHQRLMEALGDPVHYAIGRALVPARFTLKELKHVYDAVFFETTLADRDFRAHLRERRLVEPVGGASPGQRRDARLYRWRRRGAAR
jgi:8-oxo-dGTP diphosphatase